MSEELKYNPEGTEGVENVNDQISRMLLEAVQGKESFARAVFNDFLRKIKRKYKKKNESIPQVDIIVNMDDISIDPDVIEGKLQFLKAINDSNSFIKILVKSSNEGLPKIDPNLFMSGVKFEKI